MRGKRRLRYAAKEALNFSKFTAKSLTSKLDTHLLPTEQNVMWQRNNSLTRAETLLTGSLLTAGGRSAWTPHLCLDTFGQLDFLSCQIQTGRFGWMRWMHVMHCSQVQGSRQLSECFFSLELRTLGRNHDLKRQEGAARTGQEIRRFLLIRLKC